MRGKTEVNYIRVYQHQLPGRGVWGGRTAVRDVSLKVAEMREGQSDVCSVPAGAASEGKVFIHVDLWRLYNRYRPRCPPPPLLTTARSRHTLSVSIHFGEMLFVRCQTPPPPSSSPSRITLASWTNGLCPLLMTLLYHCSSWKPLWKATKLPESLWVQTIYVLHSLFLLSPTIF